MRSGAGFDDADDPKGDGKPGRLKNDLAHAGVCRRAAVATVLLAAVLAMSIPSKKRLLR